MRAADEPDGIGMRGGQTPHVLHTRGLLKMSAFKKTDLVSFSDPDIACTIAGRCRKDIRWHPFLRAKQCHLSLFVSIDRTGIAEPQGSGRGFSHCPWRAF